jgi:hypothetical protein
MGKNLLDFTLEMRFLNLLLTKHPKSGEVWSHRRWILNRWKERGNSLDSIWNQDVEICKRVSVIYPKNYHAWNHRAWILKQVNNQKRVRIYSYQKIYLIK